MSDAFLVFAVSSVVTLLIAVWSVRFKRRMDGAPDMTTSRRVRSGALHRVMFPLSAICALAAVLVAAASLLDVGERSELGVVSAPAWLISAASGDGCDSVDVAVSWMSSDDSALRRLGVLLATQVWDRAAADDDYSNSLRRDCALEVLTMLEGAGLRFGGVPPVDSLEA